MEREITDQHIEDNFAFVNRKSHPDAGLYEWEIKYAYNEERTVLLTLGPAENVMRFEYWPGCALTASGRLSQRSGLQAENP